MEKSSGIKTKDVGKGQTINTAYSCSAESTKLPNEMGGKMGGGIDNLGHSLSGASAVNEKVGNRG